MRNRKFSKAALLAMLAVSAVLFVAAARSRPRAVDKKPVVSSPPKTLTQDKATLSTQRPTARNLSLQPEALKLSKKLGKRFAGVRRNVSLMTGTLLTGTERQSISILRRQNERGEKVELALDSNQAALSWSDANGAKASAREITESERILIERLACDSADQFVLAQLRGASYYTVARNVMPADAKGSDSYSGPTWDIVRVDDPQADAAKRPLSKWRLYYINTRTGLIDKIIVNFQGHRIEAKLDKWISQDGESFPSHLTWTSEGRQLLELKLTSFSTTVEVAN